MTDYINIKGQNIEVVSSDPSNPTSGQIWYNSTTNIFKETAATAAGTWASATSLNTARNGLAGCGTQTAALGFGGYTIAPTTTTATELYDGSTWTSNPTGLNTARLYLAGCGTQTAALGFGGYSTAVTGATEEYDGSTWTSSPGSLNTARNNLAGCGTQTAALGFGQGAVPVSGATELYDGSTWTSNPNSMGTGRYTLGGAGTQAAGLAFGGRTAVATVANTEEFTGPGVAVTKTVTVS